MLPLISFFKSLSVWKLLNPVQWKQVFYLFPLETFDHRQQMLSVVSLKWKVYFPVWKSVCQTSQIWIIIVCLFFQVKIMFYKIYSMWLAQLATQSHKCFLGSAIVLRLVAEVLYLSIPFSFPHRILKNVLIGWDLIKLILLFHQDSLKIFFFLVLLWVHGSKKEKKDYQYSLVSLPCSHSGCKWFYLLFLLCHQYKWSTQWKSLRIEMKIVLFLGIPLPHRIRETHFEKHCYWPLSKSLLIQV